MLELFNRDPLHGWNVVRLVQLLRQEDTPLLLQLVEKLCPPEVPPVEDRASALAALLSALLLYDLNPDPAAAPEKLRQTLQGWLLAIVARGWLCPYDRYQAGFKLSWLSDPRDLEELQEVAAGEFILGSSNRESDAPPHPVSTPAFKIGHYPVTNASYRQFITATGRKWLTSDGWSPQRSNAPAVNVTWHDARAYCSWLTHEWRAIGRIGPDEIVRLPTEAEWEKAARGAGQPGPDGKIYPWGSSWQEDCGNTLELGLNDTCAVGMFPRGASPVGCLDMSGQVWEWVSSLWGSDMRKPDYLYPYNPTDGREDLQAPDNVRRVLRGGSLGSPFDRATCTYRGGLEPIGHWRGDGFRIVVAKEI